MIRASLICRLGKYLGIYVVALQRAAMCSYVGLDRATVEI